ncbi:NADP-dependent oxidoreductase [Klebsiella sp. 141203]|uniref:NADP-dependent oxidoreductase n=1 Tax=Klebsiella sp. 141203 TaxID=3020035 RepID=UPI002928D86A|nr:NADP-dependent oxidoreductase [Klebsiella sp. 141203]MDU9367302.1 NADP-dependent oxidoreductase [Klebsiella sp. 141203]
MRMLKVENYTELNQLSVTEGDKPVVQPGELLIRVAAVGVNPLDWKLLVGSMKDHMPTPFPFTPGLEGSGIIEAIGAGVTGYALGDRIYGRSRAMVAEYAVMQPDMVAKVPENISLIQAAAIPSSAQVAYSALHDVAQIRAGQKILIHGASGGVGQYAVQLAALAGAEIWATTSSVNVDTVKHMGADHVIDYQQQPFEDVVQGMDVVLNMVNDDLEQRSWSVLRNGGLLISLLRQPVIPDAAVLQNKKGLFMRGVQGSHMGTINQLVDAGKIAPNIDSVFDLTDVAAAYRKSRGGHVRGKILLRIASDLA